MQLAAAVLGSAVVITALAIDGLALAVPLAASPLALVAVNKAAGEFGRLPAELRVFAVIWLLLLASTFVWRGRTTQALNSNPLDAAASIRVLFVSLAGLAAFAFLTTSRIRPTNAPASLRWLGAYVVVAFLAALASPLPLQALYRAYELAVGLLAVGVALAVRPPRPGWTLMQLLLYALGGLVALIWLEALAFPSLGFAPTPGIFPYTLQGYLPSYSSNTVGTFGGVLALLGLAHPAERRGSLLLPRIALVAGVVTLLAAQYRTGIIAFLVAAVVIFWQRHRYALMAAALAVVVGVSLIGGWVSLIRSGHEAFAKGRPELIGTLDSRTSYWKAAIPLIRERPLFGWGLNVGSRRVLSAFDQGISTIHGTWIEAVLGTGVIGALFLLFAFLAALREGWTIRRHPLGAAILGVIVFMLVRTLTGTTVELFGEGFLIFVVTVVAARQLATAEQNQAALRQRGFSAGAYSRQS